MRASVAAIFTFLLSMALLPLSGCASILGDFTAGSSGDGGGSDATTDDGGDAQTADVGGNDAPAKDAAPGDTGADGAGCSPSTCPSGCCDATGACIVFAAQTGSTCGTGGGACGTCGASESCSNGACSCGGAACTGCCNSAKKCVTPTSNMACGVGGTTCQTCAANQECNAQGQCVCDAKTCPSGCCTGAAGGSCIPYASESPTQCGVAGALCTACAQPANSMATCASGKCGVTCTGGTTMCSGACVNLQSDSANCGTCGHGCGGGMCTSATCLPYVVAQPPLSSTVLGIASDGTNLLWVDGGKSGVFQIPVAGGGVTTLASGVQFFAPSNVSVANGKYAFTQTSSGPNVNLWSGTLGVANGAAKASASWPNASAYGLALTPDAQNVGFLEVPSTGGALNVYFVPTATGIGAAIDAPTCSGSGCMKSGQQVAANSRYFAWTDIINSAQGGVSLYDFTTHTKTNPTTPMFADFPVLDDTNLYWVDNASLQIWKMPLPAGTAQLVMDNGNQQFAGLATDAQNAYFTEVVPAPGSVYAVSLSGTTLPVPIYSGGTPAQIIQAGGTLFWIDTSSQKIYGLRYP